MNVREKVEATKQHFKKMQLDPDLEYLEKKRKALQQRTNYSEDVRTEKQRIRELKKRKYAAEHPLMNTLKQQIAQGGKKTVTEFKARSEEYREENKLPGGVMGSKIPSLVEEQRKQQLENEERANS